MLNPVEFCQKLISCSSVGTDIEAIINIAAAEFSQLGFKIKILKITDQKNTRPALVATYSRGNGKHLLFCGPLDVVPAGDINLWKHPPFAAQIDNGILYGRGVCDMKGGIASFVSATEKIISDPDWHGKITIILSTDEEEPVVNCTKIALQTLINRGEKFDFAIIGEPSNTHIFGDAIKIGRRGDIVINITSLGKQAHTAYASTADNPVHSLVELLHKLQAITLDNGNPYFPPSTMQITTIDVGNTASNIVPARATAQIDIRFNNVHTSSSIINMVKRQAEATEGTFEFKFDIIGESFFSPISKHIELLTSIIKKHCGAVSEYSTSGGTSDARFIAPHCPVVEFGLTNTTIHKVNECENIENILKLTQIYADFMKDFFA